MTEGRRLRVFWLVVTIVGAALATPDTARAHCDALDGPVVSAARTAIEKADVTPALVWVLPAYENEIRAAFQKTLVVRTKGAEARELADTALFETLVRLHRAGEGEPYTGLKPSGVPIEPAIAAADRALVSGRIDDLADELAAAVAHAVRTRFAAVVAARKRAGESVAGGREYVRTYVAFIHQVEALHRDATGDTAPH